MRPTICRLFIILLFLLWTPIALLAQRAQIEKDYEAGRLSLDQKVLYQLYAQEKPQQLPAVYVDSRSTPIKCGTPALMTLHRNQDKLSPSTLRQARSMVEKDREKAFQTHQSPSGRFAIHYDTAGEHAVPTADRNNSGIPDYVELVAEAADSSYRHQVQTLGYTNPISSRQPYRIELLNLQYIYGQTYTKGRTTIIQIENDFAEDFPPNEDPDGSQAGAVKATVAHELKHAIQYAATGWNGETDLWAEMDATMMEEVVYDPVNDYYHYLNDAESIFSNPQQSFYPGSYYHVSWALYFEEEYGPDFWPAVWTIIEADPDITLIEALTEQLGDAKAFNRAYIESQLWHYASGPNRSASNFGFREREHYPDAETESGRLFFSDNIKDPHPDNPNTLNSLSATYYTIPRPTNASGKVGVEVSADNQNSGIGVIAYFTDGTAATKIEADSEKHPAVIDTDWLWSDINFIGIITTNRSTDQLSSEPMVKVGSLNYDSFTVYQNFPNPFRRSTDIRFILERPSQVTLKVYDITGRLVRTLIDDELEAGPHEPTFNGSDLASGVYVYQLVTDRHVVSKKMTLIK